MTRAKKPAPAAPAAAKRPRKKPAENPADLKPVDWAGMEPHYRAGLRTLRNLSEEYGVSPPGILKHFRKAGIARDLRPRIQQMASDAVNAAAVAETVNARGPSEQEIVDANAKALASVQIAHRKDIARCRELAERLLGELEEVTGAKGIVDRIHGEIHDPQADPEEVKAALRDLALLVRNLPGRVKTMRDLADAMRMLIGMEREAFGLNTAAGTDGRPMVIIRDFTGRGDPDAPPRVGPAPAGPPPVAGSDALPWVDLADPEATVEAAS